MKILLINMPIRMTSPPNLIPTGLAIIHQVLLNHNFEVELWDLNIERPSNIQEQLKEKLDDVNMVCFSGLITTYQYQKRMAKWAKKVKPEVAVVSGGGCASSVSSLMLSNTKIDCVVVGDGDDIILEVISDFCNEKMKKQYIAGDLKFPLSQYPWPNWDVIDMKTYLANPIWNETAGNLSTAKDIEQERSINVIASRGCPFSCNFCYHNFVDYRIREVDDVINEIMFLKEKYNVDFFGFVDDNIGINKKWLVELCTKLIDVDILWGAHCRADFVESDLLRLMYKSGCRYLGFGVESWSKKILDRMNKKLDVNKAINGIWLCREYDIFPNVTYIFGDKEETVGSLKQTSEIMKQTQTQNKMFWMTPYPKTTLWKEVYKDNKIVGSERTFELEDYVNVLGDAKDFVINLTRWPYEEARNYKEACERGEL